MNVHSSPWPRTQRWLRRLLGLCLALLLLVLVAVFSLLHNLDRLWVRERLAALALARSGLEISYGAVDLRTWSELDVRDVVVRSPLAVRSVAPELLRIARFHASWWRVPPFGWHPALRTIDLEGVTLNVARDEQGRTSFDAIPSTGPTTPAIPLSQQAEQLLGTGFPVPEIRLNGVTLTLLQTDQGRLSERDSVRGVALSVKATPRLSGARLELGLGNVEAPLELTFARSRPGAPDTTASARAFLTASALPSDASAVLDVQLTRQDVLPALSVEQLLHLEASAKFEPKAGRVQLALNSLRVADDTAKSEARVELPDHGAARVQHAEGEIDAVRALRLAAPWTPEIALSRGRVRYRIEDLPLDRALPTTVIAVEAELAGARVPMARGPLSLESGRLSLHAQPSGDELRLSGSARVDGLEVSSAQGMLRGAELALTLDGRRATNGEVSGQAELAFASLAREGSTPALARDGRVSLQARDVYADPRSPLNARGQLAVDVQMASFEAGGSPRCSASQVTFHAETPLAVHDSWALTSNFSAQRVRFAPAGVRGVELPVRAEFSLKDLRPDLQQLERSSGTAHVALTAGAVHAVFDADKHDQALDYELSAGAPRLGDARPFAPDAVRALPFEQMAFDLAAKGRVTGLSSASPELEEHARLHLSGVAWSGLAASELTFAVSSRGNSTQHHGQLDVAGEGLRVAETRLGSEHVRASIDFDRLHSTLSLGFSSERLAKSELQIAAAFDREQRALTYRASGQISELSPIAPLLAEIHALSGFELSPLELRLSAQGSVRGVVSDARANGSVILEPEPLATAKLESTIELEAKALRWADGDLSLIHI